MNYHAAARHHAIMAHAMLQRAGTIEAAKLLPAANDLVAAAWALPEESSAPAYNIWPKDELLLRVLPYRFSAGEAAQAGVDRGLWGTKNGVGGAIRRLLSAGAIVREIRGQYRKEVG